MKYNFKYEKNSKISKIKIFCHRIDQGLKTYDFGVMGGDIDPVIIPIETYSDFPYEIISKNDYEIYVYCEGLTGKQGGERFDFHYVLVFYK